MSDAFKRRLPPFAMCWFVAALMIASALPSLGNATELLGRWKWSGTECYWDPEDDGPDQCDPNAGRWKWSGSECYWEPNDTGPDQCDPGSPPVVAEYSESWTYDGDFVEWDGFPTTLVYGVGVTESSYGDYVEVHTEFRDPSGNLLSWQYGASSGFARADVAIGVSPESTVEGDFSTSSYHWSSGQGLGWTLAIIGRRSVATRYRLYSVGVTIYPDFVNCEERWTFTNTLCKGDCQKIAFEMGPIRGAINPETGDCVPYDVRYVTPPQFLQGIGDRWKALWIGWCRINYYGRPTFETTTCKP